MAKITTWLGGGTDVITRKLDDVQNRIALRQHIAPFLFLSRGNIPDWIYQLKGFFVTHFWLITLGLMSECFYLFYLLRTFPLQSSYQGLTDMGIMNSHSYIGFIAFLLIFSLLFGLLILSRRTAFLPQKKSALYLILGFGFLFACTSVFVYPINAIDIFGYIAQSRVLVLYHANPMIVAPAHYTQDSFIYSLGSFVASPLPYGPLSILMEAIPTVFSGSNLLANLLLLKGFSALFLLGSSYIAYQITARIEPKIALATALFLAWNPFMQLEYVINAHNDIIMIFFVLLAILAYINNWHVAALALTLLSSLVKYSTLPLLLIFFIGSIFHYKSAKDRAKYALFAYIVIAVIAALFVLPFWMGPQTFASLAVMTRGPLYSFSMFLNDLTMQKITFDQSEVLGLGIFGGCYLYALWLASRRQVGLLAGCFLCLFALLAFAATYVQPWYIVWACIPASLIPHRTAQQIALLLAYVATMVELIHAYIWPWGAYQNAAAYAIVNSIAYLLLFGPTIFLLIKHGTGKAIVNIAHTR
jgi:hypothetical protein